MATIQKRGSTYRIRVSLGYDNEGKQIIKSKTLKLEPGMTSKQVEKELERQSILFEEKCKAGQVMDDNIKFSEFYKHWLKDYAEIQLKKKTLARYRDLMKRILPAIGHMKISKIQPHHLLALYNNLAEKGIRDDYKYTPCSKFKELLKEKQVTKVALSKRAEVSISTLNSCTSGKNVTYKNAVKISNALNVNIDDIFSLDNVSIGLSSKTILHHHRLISSIMSTAVEWQVIFSNPCDRVKPPRVIKKEATYLDEKETAKLLECLKRENLKYRTIIEVFLYTGIRRGELCGLIWDDIDFENKLIHIDKSSLYLASEGIFEDSTKNASSNRVIKISDTLIASLKEYRIWQNTQRIALGSRWQCSNKIFTAENGSPINPDTISSWFKKFTKENDLPNISVHSLRHTNATLMLASGTNLRTVANRLGHSKTSTTSDIYAHAIKTADEAAAETLQDLFNPIKKDA
ncbi:MAG: Tyrosine recombinase XerC [Eubacteriales bacterium SKADARSKE-1]|nr:Tyrosine recombinase XerC [Eubacteriales bacterium SKADARSKE-1]